MAALLGRAALMGAAAGMSASRSASEPAAGKLRRRVVFRGGGKDKDEVRMMVRTMCAINAAYFSKGFSKPQRNVVASYPLGVSRSNLTYGMPQRSVLWGRPEAGQEVVSQSGQHASNFVPAPWLTSRRSRKQRRVR